MHILHLFCFLIMVNILPNKGCSFSSRYNSLTKLLKTVICSSQYCQFRRLLDKHCPISTSYQDASAVPGTGLKFEVIIKFILFHIKYSMSWQTFNPFSLYNVKLGTSVSFLCLAWADAIWSSALLNFSIFRIFWIYISSNSGVLGHFLCLVQHFITSNYGSGSWP